MRGAPPAKPSSTAAAPITTAASTTSAASRKRASSDGKDDKARPSKKLKKAPKALPDSKNTAEPKDELIASIKLLKKHMHVIQQMRKDDVEIPKQDIVKLFNKALKRGWKDKLKTVHEALSQFAKDPETHKLLSGLTQTCKAFEQEMDVVINEQFNEQFKGDTQKARESANYMNGIRTRYIPLKKESKTNPQKHSLQRVENWRIHYYTLVNIRRFYKQQEQYPFDPNKKKAIRKFITELDIFIASCDQFINIDQIDQVKLQAKSAASDSTAAALAASMQKGAAVAAAGSASNTSSTSIAAKLVADAAAKSGSPSSAPTLPRG